MNDYYVGYFKNGELEAFNGTFEEVQSFIDEQREAEAVGEEFYKLYDYSPQTY